MKMDSIRIEECTKHSCLKRVQNGKQLCIHCECGDKPNPGRVAMPGVATTYTMTNPRIQVDDV